MILALRSMLVEFALLSKSALLVTATPTRPLTHFQRVSALAVSIAVFCFLGFLYALFTLAEKVWVAPFLHHSLQNQESLSDERQAFLPLTV